VRTYARLQEGEPFSYKAWIEAVRAGRTIVTDAPPRAEDFEDNGCDGSPLLARRAPELIEAVQSTRHWIETAGRFEQPKRKQNLLDRCNEALAKLGAAP
jgi:hypothetical protein